MIRIRKRLSRFGSVQITARSKGFEQLSGALALNLLKGPQPATTVTVVVLKDSLTLCSRAVSGMSCIRPMAPLLDRAVELKFDSALITARIRSESSEWRSEADFMRAS